jgi:redox-sensitive bicupin YhaK (pirin superfamily)
MTISIRRDDEIYRIDGGWFSARWHFSFDQYRDPEYMEFGNLRVFNDDRLIPGAIWPMHPHRDIEGLTYVVEGLFRHEDDVGGPPGPLPPGSVQRMTLGRGAYHSEQNASNEEPMRFIQTWIMPDQRGLEPGVEQKVFTKDDRRGRLLKAVSPEGGESVKVHGDASVFISSLVAGEAVKHELGERRGAYFYVISGDVEVNGERMTTGDAARIWEEQALEIAAEGESDLIMVDVDLTWSFDRWRS